MRYIITVLLILGTFAISGASADYTIGPSVSGSIWAGNSTSDNATVDQGDDNVRVGFFADNFDDNDISGWSTGTIPTAVGGRVEFDPTEDLYRTDITIVNYTLQYTFNITDSSNSDTTHLYFRGQAIGSSYQMRQRSGTTLEVRDSTGWGQKCVNSSLTITSNTTYTMRVDLDWHNYTFYLDNVEIMSFSDAAYSSGYFRHRGSGVTHYVDDVRLWEFGQHDGNITSWHDAAIGNDTYEIWFNFTSAQTHSDYYRNNATGSFTLLGANQIGNKSYTLATKYQHTDVRTTLNGNSTQTPVLVGITFKTQACTGPLAISSYTPLGTIWPEVYDSQMFTVTTNQSTQCRWYVNGTLKQTNTTPAITHTYTNTSLLGGGCNITALVNNSNGNNSKVWLFEVGANSISYISLKEQPTNQTLIAKMNITRIGQNVTDWGRWQNYTFNGWQYYFQFTNGTEIMNQTATSNNESLWFNGTSLLPTGVYFINATSSGTNTLTLYANEYALINNWTADQTYQQIAANISNDVCYSYYNSTSGLWEAYWVGYTYGATNIIPKNCSISVFVDAQTTVTATPNAGGVTITNAAWFYSYLPGSTAKTLTEIEIAMDADGLDVWALYGFDNATQEYTATSSYSVDPNEGYTVYVNTTGEYTP